MTDNTAVRYVGTADVPTKHLYTRTIYERLSELSVGHIGSSPACQGTNPRCPSEVFVLVTSTYSNYVGFAFKFLNYSTATRACYTSLQVMKLIVIKFLAPTCSADSHNL